MSITKEKLFVPIGELVVWEKNPRTIDDEGKERLKRQLKKLGQYKPLIVCKDGGEYVVLGGNMRLLAMTELIQEGFDKFRLVWVTEVVANDDKTRLEYALSDNDRAGVYDKQALVDLARGVDLFEYDDYRIDLDESMPFDVLLDLQDAESSDVDDERMEVLRVLPPEAPELRERVAIHMKNLESYLAVKKAIEEKRLTAEMILKLI